MEHPNQKHLIAYVDDVVMLREVHSAVINSFDSFEVILQADNGKDFINKLEEQIKTSKKPEIVILDIEMPEMDGIETCSWLSENHPQIKKLALTIHGSENEIVSMVEAGVNGFLTKFMRPGEFKRALSFLLKNEFYISDLVSASLRHKVRSGAKQKVNLNANETTFLKLCCRDLDFIQIAKEMNKSIRTVHGFSADLKEKLQVKGRMGFVLYSIQARLVTLNSTGALI